MSISNPVELMASALRHCQMKQQQRIPVYIQCHSDDRE